MAIPESIRRHLDAEGVDYQVISHPRAQTAHQAATLAGLDPAHVARMQAVKDRHGILLAVIPADHDLNLEPLNRQLQREFVLAPLPAPLAMFQDSTPGTVPPLPALFDLRTIIDSSLRGIGPIYFQAGSTTELVRVTARGFALLQQGAWHGEHIAQRITAPVAAPAPAPATVTTLQTPERVATKTRVQLITRLPPMPEMAQRILQLRANPYAGVHDLARIVELDPSLAAQVLRYAASPLFGYRGKLSSIQDAVSRVLGYDMVMNIAIGIAAGRAFRVPLNGPLGLHAHWHNALYCAALSQALSKLLPREQHLQPGLAYLAGLLHDFGFLLFGQMFPEEFARLNDLLAAQRGPIVHNLEQDRMGVTHTELGTWLMEAWGMPAEITAAVREHHNPGYEGAHAAYPRLVMLARHLLQSHGLGMADAAEPPGALLAEFGLSAAQVDVVVQSFLQGAPALDDMARQIAA